MSDDMWLSDREQRTWRAFLDMQRLLFGHINRQVQREFGLSGADFEILVNLSESETGRMRAFELSRATQWEKSRMSHQLSRMAARGLVRKEATTDPRYSDIVLTEQGRAAIVAAAPRSVDVVRETFLDPIGDARLDLFREACDAVSAVLDENETDCR
jgi:DNA-binding MarR family transcriptional regulator